MQWLWGGGAAEAPKPSQVAGAPQGHLDRPGPGVALDVLTVRSGEALSSSVVGDIPKGAQLTVQEVRGRRAQVVSDSGVRGWVSLHQPDMNPLVGPGTAKPKPAQPPAAPKAPAAPRIDAEALAQRILLAYDDNLDKALDYREMCAHEKDLGRSIPSQEQFQKTCTDVDLDPKKGITADVLAQLLRRITPDQLTRVEASLAAREREVSHFASLVGKSISLSGYLEQQVAGYISTGPVRKWLRLEGGQLHVSADPITAPTESVLLKSPAKIQESTEGPHLHLKVESGDGRSIVFSGHGKDEHDLWSGFLALAIAQSTGQRVPLALRDRYRDLLLSAPPATPLIKALPEEAEKPKHHGYSVTCTYWSMLGPNWKRRYITLHKGWWSVREAKEDAAGLLVMPLRHAFVTPDAAQAYTFNVSCRRNYFQPVTLWCDGEAEHSVWRAAFDREISRAKGEGRLLWELFQKQDAACSQSVVITLAGEPSFDALALSEGRALVKRDEEDDVKLLKGIEFSISRGAIKKIKSPPVTVVDVVGKTVEQVTDQIAAKLPKKGCVVVLQGMSGTGKSTTTKRLLQVLPNSVGWSNGNVFRSITLLAATHCQTASLDLKKNADEVLTVENIARWMGMLSFESEGGKYNIRIRGLGYDCTVEEVATTLLQEPRVAQNIPTVAEKTQGEVITFAAAALQKMAADGKNVVLEGRAATVQYVPTPYRFELVLKDPTLLGQRRAAQRVIGAVAKQFTKESPPDEAQLRTAALAFCEKETSKQ